MNHFGRLLHCMNNPRVEPYRLYGAHAEYT